MYCRLKHFLVQEKRSYKSLMRKLKELTRHLPDSQIPLLRLLMLEIPGREWYSLVELSVTYARNFSGAVFLSHHLCWHRLFSKADSHVTHVFIDNSLTYGTINNPNKLICSPNQTWIWLFLWSHCAYLRIRHICLYLSRKSHVTLLSAQRHTNNINSESGTNNYVALVLGKKMCN